LLKVGITGWPSILQKGRICGGDKREGFVKGPLRAVCFMDVPFDSLTHILHEETAAGTTVGMEAFGVFVTKKHGCRPVHYLSNEEGLPQLPRTACL